MRSKLFLLLVVLQVCAFSAFAQVVNEKMSSIRIKEVSDREANAEVSLAVDSSDKRETNVLVQLLDGEDKVRATGSQTCALKKGASTCKIIVPVGDMVKKEDQNFFWFRLQYKVGDSSGVLSLSELLKDSFELRAAIPRSFFPGTNYRIRVRALQPFTKAAVKNVLIEGKLTIEVEPENEDDDDEIEIIAKSKTDDKGMALIDFTIPEGKKIDHDASIEITGRKNGLTQEVKADTDEPRRRGGLYFIKDKPLYQPGQSFGARGILLDNASIVVPNYELEMRIEDEDDTVLFSQKVKTSEYGIAAISWQIPENAKLGSYKVTVESDGFDEISMPFIVTRYDLPYFTVDTKTDRTYYLPSDKNASVTVKADYLFGKEVKRGKVRLVEETERRWDRAEQKYVTEEGRVFEGTTDADGKFVADVDITAYIAELNSNSWTRYEDVRFSAYFTDTDTNRTEQKRFDIRLTKEPIHVYLVRGTDVSAALPFKGYFSAFYADGAPAECNVMISGEGNTVVKTKTNNLGAGKFSIDIPVNDPDDRRFNFKIQATDKKGLVGTLEDDVYTTKRDQLRVETDKTIYAPGDVVDIDVTGSMKTGLLYLDLVKDEVVISSFTLNLRNGKANLQVPFNQKYKGEITIAAYLDEGDEYGDIDTYTSHAILFPEQQNLKVDAKFSKNIYRPNDEASLKFSVFDGSGRSTQGALGIAIFDKAVEERARTDSEFGYGYFRPFYDMMGYGRGFGNTTFKDLNDIDLTKPVKEEMQLVAEIILADSYYYPEVKHSTVDLQEAKTIYGEYFKKQFERVESALKKEFDKTGRHPYSDASLRTLLLEKDIDLNCLLDPWGKKYTASFSIEKSQIVVVVKSAGADKTHETGDDLAVWSAGYQYFAPLGARLNRAIYEHYKTTGKLVRERETLALVLKKEGIDLDTLKDAWGKNYRVEFSIEGRNSVVRVISAGANGRAEPLDKYSSDDFQVWAANTDYFAATEIQLRSAMSKAVKKNGSKPPRDEAEFTKMLAQEGVSIAEMRDIFEETVYLRIERKSVYADKSVIEKGKQVITPVIQELLTFRIRSKGEDRIFSGDDFELTSFSTDSIITASDLYESSATATNVMYSGARGAIRGKIADAMGAAIPGVVVRAKPEGAETTEFSATTDENGGFLLENLPSGRYTVDVVSAHGFKGYRATDVLVRSMNLVELNIILEVGNVSAAVTVSGARDSSLILTSDSRVVTTVSYKKPAMLVGPDQTSTPRLREYFPETLFWNPEVVTDAKGKAEVKFKMADNITTWKMYSIASTKKGKIGIAEKEVTAFQPFFVDLEPPKFLTNGDEISLPVQIRNYTEKKQNVSVTMAKGDWFTFLGQDKQSIGVEKGDSANAIFGFRAEGPVKNGKQRVTAIAQGDSDAIEKPVTVRPDGEEIVKTDTRIFKNSQEFDVSFPANAIQKTQKAELKIYPNLFAHVTESVEGLLQRPYGCGEQTVSSTYPNVMVLKFDAGSAELKRKAQNYLQKGYERLTGYQAESGGFTYWGGKDEPDAALTAYALRFLHDAGEFIEVDEKRIKRANDWLVKQQRADGSWTKKYYYENTEDRTRTKLFTSYVARTLAVLPDTDKAVLQKALDYLKTRNAEIDEPYAMALYGLALLDAGKKEEAGEMAATLSKMAIEEGDGVYWKLETNTPFYGWGTAGRLETTALVLQLLIREAQASGVKDPARDSLTSRATLFLLKSKDRYGVWYSTQTTINVLNAFLASLTKDAGSAAEVIQISVNGGAPENVEIKPGQIEMLTIDLTGKLTPAENKVEVKSSSGSTVMAQIVREHYIEWKDSESTGINVNRSRALRLEHKCDKSAVKIMEEVTCTVDAERLAFKGYGMLLAEIGTPPGADVSRESLEKAIGEDWSISKYDILPDRIVVYMWAKAGGTKFSYKFKPRYGINAQTPASGVYDYYNPEAKAVSAPLRLIAR